MATTNPKNVPALVPPPGVIPNFGDPYSLSPAFVVTAVLSLLLATAAVIMRLAVSLSGSTRRLRVEDCEFLRVLGFAILEVVKAHADMTRRRCRSLGE